MKKQIFCLIPLFLLLMAVLLTACSHTHEYETWTLEKEASCTENGQEVRLCKCGHQETRFLPRANHTEGVWNTVTEPSCTSDGLKQLACSDCKLVLQVVAIPAADHTAEDWVVVAEPTCTAEGLMHQTCANCKLVLQASPIPAADHTAGDWVTVAASTCTAAGLKHQYCADCNIILQVAAIPAEDHTEGVWNTVAAPTCTAAGLKHQSCTACKLVLQVAAIPATGHTEGDWIIDKEPTITQEGSKHQICKICSVTLKIEKIPVIPRFTVVLDAGHGGKDSGAVSNGVLEKHINLQITLKMKELLEAQGIAVILTREDDVFLELEERADFANNRNVHLFVSIHCNSYDDSSASGFEVFYYRNSQAKSVANTILSDLEATGQVKIRSVKTAQYYVLKYTSMPAILLEMGFITNKQEREKLCSDAYQDLMARSIASSIVRALNQMK